MQNDALFQYIKLFSEYFPLWSLVLLGTAIWLYRNPEHLKSIPAYVDTARIGSVELKLRQMETKLSETEAHVTELEEENARLSSLYAAFDPDAPVKDLEQTRQSLKAMAGNLETLDPVLAALQPGAGPADVYAAAEILRTRRDFSAFDPLVEAVARIAADPKLEGLRYHTVWTLASAVHRTVLAAVKHRDRPALSAAQLTRARAAMQRLHDNPHVQHDRPDAPARGIRGPARHALNWIDQGIGKLRTTDG